MRRSVIDCIDSRAARPGGSVSGAGSGSSCSSSQAGRVENCSFAGESGMVFDVRMASAGSSCELPCELGERAALLAVP